MYYTRKSFTQCLLNELNSSQHSKKRTEFASVVRRQAILKKLQSTAGPHFNTVWEMAVYKQTVDKQID